mgnify:CR=1 FL=1
MFVYPMIFSKFQVGKLLKVHMFSIVPVASFFVGDFAVCSKFICLQLKKPDNCLYYLVSFTPNYNSPLNKPSPISPLTIYTIFVSSSSHMKNSTWFVRISM